MTQLYNGKQYEFYQAALKHLKDDETLGPVRKMVIRRRLQRPKFLELAMEEYTADIQWEDPDFPAEINYGELDWNMLLSVLLTLLKLWL